MLLGSFVPGNERPLCGRFVPGNESAWKRNVPGVPFSLRVRVRVRVMLR